MLDQLAYLLGGRAAEEIVFHDPTTGAANDIEKATSVARAMVTQFGMTERIGAIKLGSENSEPFLGRDMGHQRDYSEEVARIVDEEVRSLIDSAHDEAYAAINANRDLLDHLVLELLEKETLNVHELAELFKPVVKQPARPTWLSSQTRQLSDRPPVLTPAEIAAQNGYGGQNGHLPPPVPADKVIEDQIDEAAAVGAHPLAEEHPAERIVEVPDDRPVNPDEKG
jgi:cell division protease FtsH